MIKLSLILATLCCISCFSNKLEELDQKYASGSGSGLDYYDYSGYGSIDYNDYSGSGSGIEVERALPKTCKNAKNPERCRRKKKKQKENGEEDGEETRIASGSGSSDYYDYSGSGSIDYYGDYYDYYGSGMDYYGDYYDYSGSGSALKEIALPKKCKNAKNPERCRRKKKKQKENGEDDGEEDGEEARISSGSGSMDYYD